MRTLAMIPVALMLLLSGCANPELTAYKIIGSTTVSVDAAMNGWGDYVKAGKASTNDIEVVRGAYEKYQAFMRTAKAAIMSYKTGALDRSALDVALDAVDASKTELILLIATLRK